MYKYSRVSLSSHLQMCTFEHAVVEKQLNFILSHIWTQTHICLWYVYTWVRSIVFYMIRGFQDRLNLNWHSMNIHFRIDSSPEIEQIRFCLLYFFSSLSPVCSIDRFSPTYFEILLYDSVVELIERKTSLQTHIWFP